MSKFMRVMVMFDLPTDTKKQRSDNTKFRNALIKNGFYMMQYSIYVKLCNGWDAAKSAEIFVETIAPLIGAIRTLLVTEKQYASMKCILGPKYYQESIFNSNFSIFL